MPSLIPTQTRISPTAPSLPWRITAFAGQGLKRAWLWPVRFFEARQEMAMFARMSEHDLRDIGLTAADVSNASALQRDELPSVFLTRAAIQARRSQKAWQGQ